MYVVFSHQILQFGVKCEVIGVYDEEASADASVERFRKLRDRNYTIETIAIDKQYIPDTGEQPPQWADTNEQIERPLFKWADTTRILADKQRRR